MAATAPIQVIDPYEVPVEGGSDAVGSRTWLGSAAVRVVVLIPPTPDAAKDA